MNANRFLKSESNHWRPECRGKSNGIGMIIIVVWRKYFKIKRATENQRPYCGWPDEIYGTGENGTVKMVWTKWYKDKMVLDKMAWTKWYGQNGYNFL